MNLTLIRTAKRPDGVFSILVDDCQEQIGATLEHAYPVDGGLFEPKLKEGTYVCKRGTHRLEHGEPFETFEITGVEGHSGILFHTGNWNRDSNGCVLTGQWVADDVDPWYIAASRSAFRAFMKLQEGADEFLLTVVDPLTELA